MDAADETPPGGEFALLRTGVAVLLEEPIGSPDTPLGTFVLT